MEIPPEDRQAAHAFLAVANEVRVAERRMVRDDVVALAALGAAIGINVYGAMAGGVFGALSMAVVVILSFVAGMKFVQVHNRRESFRQVDAMADQTETALAFYELDDAS